MRRNVLLLLVALVAAFGAALFSAPSVYGRLLLDWEDDLRPRYEIEGGKGGRKRERVKDSVPGFGICRFDLTDLSAHIFLITPN